MIEHARAAAEEYAARYGIASTLRGLFYILVSRGVVPNTRGAYKALSEKVARARYLGEFPWYLIRDETRTFKWGEYGQSIADAQRVVEELRRLAPEEKERLLRDYLSSRYTVRLSRWEGQRCSILIVVEKEAQLDAVDKMVNTDLRWDVSVTTSRGFESATAVRQIADWVGSVKRKGRTPVLLLVFDWDPSGEYAGVYDLVFRVLALLDGETARTLREWERARTLEEKGGLVRRLAERHGLVFEKVMLTWEQVRKYGLPPVPQDEEARRKLERDSRARVFAEKYGFLGQVEVDAMVALYYDEAKRLLDEAVRRYFDPKVYEEVKRREEELREEVKKLLGGGGE